MEPILLTLTGKDKPGITSSICATLAQVEAELVDIHQTLLFDHLTLSMIIHAPKNKSVLKELLFKAHELELKLDFKVLEKKEQTLQKKRFAITLLGNPITPKALSEILKLLSLEKVNIDQIKKLSIQKLSALEFHCSSKDLNQSQIRQMLADVGSHHGVDLAFQEENAFRRSKRLIVFDMDSTLIENEVIDEMAELHGVGSKIKEITERAMQGQMDFNESIRKRVSLLKGFKEEDLKKVLGKIVLTEGAIDLIRILKKLGYQIALISGGFQFFADHFKNLLKIDEAYANELEWKDKVCTGNLVGPIVNAERKADLLSFIAKRSELTKDQIIAIGDGANDLLMIEAAGLGICFQGKKALRDKADFSLNHRDLRNVLYLLGFNEQEILECLEMR